MVDIEAISTIKRYQSVTVWPTINNIVDNKLIIDLETNFLPNSEFLFQVEKRNQARG
jgi:hypothetical protein